MCLCVCTRLHALWLYVAVAQTPMSPFLQGECKFACVRDIFSFSLPSAALYDTKAYSKKKMYARGAGKKCYNKFLLRTSIIHGLIVSVFTDARWFYSSVCEAWACKGSYPLMGLSLH